MQHGAIHRLFTTATARTAVPAILRVTNHTTGETVEESRGMSADSPLLLASVTKLVTAACVLRLAGAGRLSLSDPVLPLLDDDVRAPLASLPGSGSLTVGSLLSQTSGLPDPFEHGADSFAKRLITEDFGYTTAEMTTMAAALPQHRVRGRRAYYSDANFDLLGAVLETIHGRPYPETVRAEITDPLGLQDLRIPAPGERVPAVEYRSEQLERPEFIRANGPSGGGLATALELERFVVALFTGKLCRTDALLDPALYRWLGPQMGLLTYGPGAMRFTARFPFGPKVEAFGHIGSTGSFAFWVPSKTASLVGTVNRFGAGPTAARLAMHLALRA